jgi:formylglycine-generating enzyme required for sulfatase activity
MLNWILVALLLLALVGIGALAMMIDSGIEDKNKQKFVYALFGLFGLIGIVFMMVEDKSAFVYGDWESQGKKGGKKAKQYAEVDEGAQGEQAEVGVTYKNSSQGGDDASGSDSGKTKEAADGRDCDVCPPMVKLVGGKTVVGTLFREAGQGGPILGPLQEVTLPAFAISRYEITVAQFSAFVKAKGYKPANTCRIDGKIVEGADFRSPGFEQTPEHPAVCISWYDAAAYADWLTQKTGRRYLLPTEVEWEHAARAGTLDAYATGKQIHGAQAQYRTVGVTRKGTVSIGQFSANKYGFYDMHGNAAEMIRNCWNTSEVAVGATTGDCSVRTMKGGGWTSTAAHLQFAARAAVPIKEADNTIGFRVARYKE